MGLGIEVDEQQCQQGAVAPGQRQAALDAVHEQAAVGRVGQNVVMRQVVDFSCARLRSVMSRLMAAEVAGLAPASTTGAMCVSST